MPIELPQLRLALAGFTAEQQEQASNVIARSQSPHFGWQLASLADADAWWISGAKSTLAAAGVLRVAAATPSARALQVTLGEFDRPLAFTTPVAGEQFEDAFTFDLANPGDAQAVLIKFAACLQPLVSQFGLAASVVEHYGALGTGVFDVELDGRLLAVVDMRRNVGVLPGAAPLAFSNAIWRRRTSAQHMPQHFTKTSMSQLMWQYALRTARDLLPAHYRSARLFFRRPPRLAQQLLADAHLLLLRELAHAPASFAELEQRTGLAGEKMARALAALYYVGAITSNPKRAATLSNAPAETAADSAQYSLSSVMATGEELRRIARHADLTAPAPLMR